MPQKDSEPEEQVVESEERRGTYKRADLYKMHTYRDALTHARSVRVLYPGDEQRFFAADDARAKESAGAAASPFDGVGAVPLRPEAGGRRELDALLAQLLVDHRGRPRAEPRE